MESFIAVPFIMQCKVISKWGGGALPYLAYMGTCLIALNRVYNFRQDCPKQGLNLS